jgi:hypothetical protein
MSAATLPALIQRFFTDRLCVQMEASRHTVAGYRDTFRLLLRFTSAAGQAHGRRHRHRSGRRLPPSWRDGAWEHGAQPQHAARRDPFVLPLRRDD